VRGGDSPTISADGRFVAFESGDEILVRDRLTGGTELASVSTGSARAAGGVFRGWGPPAISGDGGLVAFWSLADSRAVVRDRRAATTETLAVSINVGQTPVDSAEPAISADGQWVVFVTAGQVFARSRVTGAAELVSATAEGGPANRDCRLPAISADGRFVAFQSGATNLAPGDTNNAGDVFVRDRRTGITELVSVAGDGAPARALSLSPAISADGRFIAFESTADNLVPGQAGGIFVRDRQIGTTECVSVAADGGPANGWSLSPAISADGRFVAFDSEASNLVVGDTNGQPDVFVRDRQTGRTEIVSVSTTGQPAGGESPVLSADGRFVAFQSDATNLVPGYEGGIFVRDRETGKMEIVSVTATGGAADDGCWAPVVSADGRFVAFASSADNLVPGDVYGGLFVRDRTTGTTEWVAYGDSPAISGDGRFVAFQSWADNLVVGDTNGKVDVFVAERG
jgi:Tol biopolymer transport system component